MGPRQRAWHWTLEAGSYGFYYLEDLEEALGATKTIGISMAKRTKFSAGEYVLASVAVTLVLTLALVVASKDFRIAVVALFVGVVVKSIGGLVRSCASEMRRASGLRRSSPNDLMAAYGTTLGLGWLIVVLGEVTYSFGCVLALFSGRWYPGAIGWVLSLVGALLTVGQLRYFIHSAKKALAPKPPEKDIMHNLAARINEPAGRSWIN
jgi:hypothetical protein